VSFLLLEIASLLTCSFAQLPSRRRSSPQLPLITNSTLTTCRASGWISDSPRTTLRVSRPCFSHQSSADQ
jgi:hypothetical protein